MLEGGSHAPVFHHTYVSPHADTVGHPLMSHSEHRPTNSVTWGHQPLHQSCFCWDGPPPSPTSGPRRRSDETPSDLGHSVRKKVQEQEGLGRWALVKGKGWIPRDGSTVRLTGTG